jgi:hypothetical protein
METEAMRGLVEAVWAAFASRDAALIARHFTDDAEWIAPPGNGTATALGAPDRIVGAGAIAHFIATDMHRLFVDVRAEVRGLYADRDTAVVEMRLTSPLPNGGRYENDYCFVFTAREGRIDRMREYMDTLGGHRQLFAEGNPLETRVRGNH